MIVASLGACVALGLLQAGESAMQPEFVAIPVPAPTSKVQRADGSVVLTLQSVRAERAFTELVPSWAARTDGDGRIRVDFFVGPQAPGRMRFRLGEWSYSGPRTSVNGQNAAEGRVLTDILRVPRPVHEFHPEITLVPGPDGRLPQLHSLFVVLTSGVPVPSGVPLEPIPRLPVPKRAQMSYPNGGVLCSPTCVSMVLQYWSKVLDRPEIDRDVPMVQAGVYDAAWGGTGNWTFNAAYAATVPGMTAYVSRFRDVRDIALWLRRGVPVITSVSYDLLKGEGTRGENDGHLVVVTGIAEDGRLLFNDPGRNVVEVTYERAHFEAAWATSNNTVYLIYPETWMEPARDGAPWRQR